MTPIQQLDTIIQVATSLQIADVVSRAEQLRRRLSYNKVHLVVIGEFNRGKTTLVNALIGQKMLPMDIVPTTAAIWTIEKGESASSAIIKIDGSEQEIPSDLESFSRLSAEGDLCKPDVRFVRITVPRLAAGDNVVIIDTPGVNDINEQRAEITYGFLGAADAAVFLMDASSPVTKSEAEFLQGQVLNSALDKILFVLNKSSRLDEDELDEAVEIAEARLEELVGRKLPVLAADTLRILEALESCNLELAKTWGWQQLQNSMDKLLVAARDAENRKKSVRAKVKALARYLIKRLKIRLDAASLEAEELANESERLDQKVRESEDSFVRLLGFVDQHGRERLKLLVAQSLRHSSKDFIDAQQPRIAAMGGDIMAFVEKVLPYEIQLFNKQWFENRSREIERFLTEFSLHIAGEYNRHYGKVIAFSNQNLGNLQTRGADAQVDFEGKQSNEILMMGLPIAGAVAAGFLLTGPLMLVGLFAGQLLQKRIRERETEALKARLLAELPGMLDACTAETLTALNASIDRWFDVFHEALKRQFGNDVTGAMQELKLLTDGKDPDERRSLVERLRNAIDSIRAMAN